ncbi:MAG: FHA domain-containing protein [Acidobacteria bacterium]|nr:FHA domain-containing protein [Acidobacteriota bacterium]
MKEPKLIINSETELGLGTDLVTIGRASDNIVSFSDDSNVSRYHAEIERRGDDYWLIDLGSFNGTKLNGEKLEGEKPLNDGDQAVFGGTSKIEIVLTPKKDGEEEPESEAEPEADPADTEAEADGTDAAPPPQKKSGIPLMLVVAGLAMALAVVCVVGAALFYFTRETAACDARARIIKPERGDTLKEPTSVEVEITNEECVQKAVYTIEGKEFASSEEPPFSVKIEPDEFPEFADGLNRNLKVILFDQDGNQISQSEEIAFFIETIEVVPPTDTETPAGDAKDPNGKTGDSPTDTESKGKDVSIKDTIAMSGNVLKQFSGNNKYKFDQRFLQEVNKAAASYVSEGYFERAQKYRDVINVAFIREQNLDPPLGYILAMSRSKFLPKNNADGTGLWRMSNDFVVANSYNGLCGEETIASAAQNCAAKASSLYLKALILNIFEGDVVYGIAAFGMSPQEADAWKETLPADRTDFWNVIKSPQQRQEVVNFFAAAMVAENPQKFGLTKDRPLSELYSVFMK